MDTNDDDLNFLKLAVANMEREKKNKSHIAGVGAEK